MHQTPNGIQILRGVKHYLGERRAAEFWWKEVHNSEWYLSNNCHCKRFGMVCFDDNLHNARARSSAVVRFAQSHQNMKYVTTTTMNDFIVGFSAYILWLRVCTNGCYILVSAVNLHDIHIWLLYPNTSCKHVWHTNKMQSTCQSVLLFSNLDKICFVYFDPKIFC